MKGLYRLICSRDDSLTLQFFLQVEEDLEKGIPGAVPIPPDDVGKHDVIAALVANVEAMIKADRKITSLKQLQVSRAYMQTISPFNLLSCQMI